MPDPDVVDQWVEDPSKLTKAQLEEVWDSMEEVEIVFGCSFCKRTIEKEEERYVVVDGTRSRLGCTGCVRPMRSRREPV